MNPFVEMFHNYFLICAFVGFLSAQTVKFFVSLIFFRKVDFKKLIENGGMPSSHTATVLSLTVALARVNGTTDATFAVAFILSMVVMIDALGVRRATGDNSKVLSKILQDLFEGKNTQYLVDDLREYVGHKPLEVFVGGIIGVCIPFLITPF